MKDPEQASIIRPHLRRRLQQILIGSLSCILILTAYWLADGHELALARIASDPVHYILLGKMGLLVPFIAAAGCTLFLLALARGSRSISYLGFGALGANLILIIGAITQEAARLHSVAGSLKEGESILLYLDPMISIGIILLIITGLFNLKISLHGNAAFGINKPKAIHGKRAIHGQAQWMNMKEARNLFPSTGTIILGEAYRVDQDTIADCPFLTEDPTSWGKGGNAPLLAFDSSFGSTHGLAFAGSGGFKTTSLVIPTALTFDGSMIILDPSTEIAALTSKTRQVNGHHIHCLDPNKPDYGFNVLDWIGSNASSVQEDIASIAAWLMSERPGLSSGSDDFFRTSAEQLITALLADILLSPSRSELGEEPKPTLHLLRARLAKPEDALKEQLSDIHQTSPSRFVREMVAPYINLAQQTFSGIYATAAKETHWLSYERYASLVCGKSFTTQSLCNGHSTLYLNLDLSALENHPGLARLIIGACLKSAYNRQGQMPKRCLFLLDEAARLGTMRILETARDVGRKYQISLILLFQSLGQIRQAYGGQDAISKWFESASWLSFAAINDLETARFLSDRCGTTTVETDQISRSYQSSSSGRTKSKQLSSRPLILPHEVTQMRKDEQIILTAGNPPLRCGRAIYFRRKAMRDMTVQGEN